MGIAGRWLVNIGLLAAATSAQAETAEPSTIQVLGVGSVETMPEVASLTFDVRGEGSTADEATAALVSKQKAVVAALDSLDGVGVAVETGGLSILEVRDPACRADDEDDSPRLSKGACAIRGYVAELGISARVTPAARAGTLLGIVARQGASNAELQQFRLRNPADAKRRATAAALADAKSRAETIAAASGTRLGPLLGVVDSELSDQGLQEIVVTAQRRAVAAGAPVEIELKPSAITTYARLNVTYAILK